MSFLEIQNLSLKINEVSILHEVSLEVPEPSFLCILGPNGAGKSMLVKVILGIVQPTQGSVSLWKRPPQDVPADWIGYVPQIKTFDRSFPGQAIELAVNGIDSKWPARISKSQRIEAERALDQVDALSLAQKDLSRLSGGELQRVFLARAFIRPRKLLILDEPATGIDALGEADLYPLLEDYAEKNSSNIVMITHDIEVARHHASHVLLLNHRQIEFSPKEEGLSEESIQRAFGHSQHDHL